MSPSNPVIEEEAAATVLLYRIDSSSDTAPAHRVFEEDAQDAVLAYALRDEVAILTPERLPDDAVWLDEGGSLIVTREADDSGHDLALVRHDSDMKTMRILR